jgi:hypothetical protein
MLFRVGKVSVSAAVLESGITPVELISAFERYIRGDWGEIDGLADVHNDLAIADGSRIVGTYVALDGVRFTITTERGHTHIVFPEEMNWPPSHAIA